MLFGVCFCVVLLPVVRCVRFVVVSVFVFGVLFPYLVCVFALVYASVFACCGLLCVVCVRL